VVRAASGGVVVLAVAFLAAWAVRVLTHRGSLDHFNAVPLPGDHPAPAATPFVVAAAALLTGLVLWRRRTVRGPGSPGRRWG
jgi:hypothetical protein